MRIAMLQSSLPPSSRAGGVGHQVDLLAAALQRRGHDVVVFAVDGGRSDSPYECRRVDVRSRGPARILTVGWNFARLDFTGFEVVHAHGDDWLLGRRPRIRTFYGTALMEARAASTWSRRLSQLCYYGLEWVSSVNRSCVAISDTTRRYLPLIRACIPCAYDPGVFFPGDASSEAPSILFVAGTLRGRKRGDLLLASFDEVRRAIPEAQLTVVSHDRVVHPGVTCLSDVDSATLANLYRSHWLLCSTSSYEGFGVPYIEALASGLPVVTTPNHGAAEVLRNGRLGVIAAPQDLARAMIALIGDGDRRDAFRSAGLTHVRRYSIELVANEYEELYSRLI